MLEQERRRPSTSERRRPSIGLVLCVVALIPLIGLGVFTVTSVREVRAAGSAAERTKQLADQTVVLAELNAAVFDELVWASVDAAITGFNAPPGAIGQLLEQDPASVFQTMAARTDALAAESDRPDVTEALVAIRSSELDFDERLRAYDEVIESIEEPLGTLLDEAISAATETGEGESLAQSIVVLQAAVETRALYAQEFSTYFSAVFAVRDRPSVEITRLIALRFELEETLEKLRSNPLSGARLLEAIERIDADERSRSFAASIDSLIDDRLANTTPDIAAELTLESVLVNAEGFLNALQTLPLLSDANMVMVDSAGDSVLAAAETIRSDAQRTTERSYLLAFSLIAASTFAAVVAAWYIIRPLRHLRDAVEHLQSDADLDALRPIGGPSEVRSAGHAIEQAAMHIELVTRQARALSVGELDADVLDEEVPGGLGVALQHAVATLRTALTQQDEFRRRLAHEAAHDGLTKIANRNASVAQLHRSLARTHRSGGQLAVLFVDLDQFKDVNDSLGHLAGDAVLATVAQRLVNSVREGDHVGRLGGDEFVVIAEPVQDIDEAVSVAERVLEALSQPIDLSIGSVTIGASIGIALTDGKDLSADELLRDADLAVYQAKDAGRGAIAVCDEDLRTALAETADLTAAIRHAIAHDELELFYQPIVDTSSERLHAFEALVRWRRPGRPGLVPPDDFIPFAERTSLIIDIDRWVLEAAARQAAEWKSNPHFDGIPIAINVSGRHLIDEAFVDHIVQPLAKFGVDPGTIIIEITESALLDDLGGAAAKLQRLREHGIRVSIDDFGTGYTSLAHLRSLPIDVLKIDRSFTANAGKNEHEASIVKLIIDTGHLLGATVTAEGIETLDDVAKLTGLGSDNLQGYYYARPMAPADIVTSEATRTANRH